MQQSQGLNLGLSDFKAWNLSNDYTYSLVSEWLWNVWVHDYWEIHTLLVIPRLTATKSIHLPKKSSHTFGSGGVFKLVSSLPFRSFLFQLTLLEWNDNFLICSFISQLKEQREKQVTWTDGGGVPWRCLGACNCPCWKITLSPPIKVRMSLVRDVLFWSVITALGLGIS